MSRTHTVAFSELTRVLPWSLRALGYPLGTADRGSHVIATAAALDPAALDDIARLGDRPEGGFRVLREEGAGITIRAEGVSLLEVGPAVMDYCAAHARDEGWIFCRIIGATDAILLPAVLLVGAEYGLGTLAVRRQNGELNVLAAEPGARGPMLHDAGNPAGFVGFSSNPRVDAWMRKADPEADDIMVLASWHSLDLDRSEAIRTVDADRVLQAHMRGIPVSETTLRAIYDLETRTWMPSSERSRGQAGFTVSKEPAT